MSGTTEDDPLEAVMRLLREAGRADVAEYLEQRLQILGTTPLGGPGRTKAKTQLLSVCSPKGLGDVNVPSIGWYEWLRLIRTFRRKVASM